MNLENPNSMPIPAPETRRPWYVVAAVADLMFTAKISTAAKQAGCPVKFLQQQDRLSAAVREAPADHAALVIVDLNHLTLKPIEFIHQLRSSTEMSGISVLAYLSHTQVDLKRAAEQAGCDLVLPRSVFSQNIHEILRQQSCHLPSLSR